MKKIQYLLLVLGCMLLSVPTFAQSKSADKILGTYLVQMPMSENTAKMKFFRSANGTYSARVIWASHMQDENSRNATDVNNPDPK